MAKRLIIIGATGSIGRQTLDVVRERPDLFQVAGMSSHRDEAGLRRAATEHPGARLALSGVSTPVDGISTGARGLDDLIRGTDADIVVNGASGSGGLYPSLAALESGKDLALANKESVVMGWHLLVEAAAARGNRVTPVDSEHAALFQLVHMRGKDDIEELIITASGGAFRDRKLSELAEVTADEAARHPNWSMGRKITIDSATMANKGLEIIEAARLFEVDANRIKALIHPQSLVHALIRTRDGSLYAQISEPDMRVPIQNALTWPATLPCPFGRLELGGKSMDFREPDPRRYPMLGLAYEALRGGEGCTVAYNAADEVAVAAFEAGRIRFTDIAPTVERTLEAGWPSRAGTLESILDLDSRARETAARAIEEHRC